VGVVEVDLLVLLMEAAEGLVAQKLHPYFPLLREHQSR
jgi:hypothetical protein